MPLLVAGPPVSAVLITRDAARCLDAVLAALTWCAEIVIVDSGSTDDTLAIARRHGARIYQRPFDGFGPQKRWAIAQATHDWVLNLDADEVLTPALSAEIQTELAANAGRAVPLAGYWLPRRFVFLGAPMRFGAESAQLQLRLFDRRAGTFDEAPVHEQVRVQGAVGRLRHLFLHDSYADLADAVQKMNRYTSLGARALAVRNRRVSAAGVVGRAVWALHREYWLRGNFLNGYRGLVWAVVAGLNTFFKYAKLRERQQ